MKGGGQGLEALRSGVSDEKDAQLAYATERIPKFMGVFSRKTAKATTD